MSPQTPGSELGLQISSPFLCAGRGGLLMPDGEHYATLREGVKLSNMGPGYYNLQDPWRPAAFVKYNKRPTRTAESLGRHEQQAMSTMNHNYNSITCNDKPWRQKGMVPRKSRSRQEIAADAANQDPFDTAEVDLKMSVGTRSREMQQKDMDEVRDLPQYFR